MDGRAQHILGQVNCVNLILEFGSCPLCTKGCKTQVVFACQSVQLAFWRLHVSWPKPEPAVTSCL